MKIRANRGSDNRPGHSAAVWLTTFIFACFLPIGRAEQPSESVEALADRGAILIQTGEYEAAEVMLGRALELQPELWSAQFSLARILLLKRDWAGARHRFEVMRPADGESAQFIQYEILLTHLLAGENVRAAEIVKQLEANPDSQALVYARAALAWQDDAGQEAEKLTSAAKQKAGGRLAPLYAASFGDVGWEVRLIREARLSPNDQGKSPVLLSNSDQP